MNIKLTKDEHRLFAAYIKKISGIHLDDTKDYLVQSRLYKFLDVTESSSFQQLYNKAILDKTGHLEKQIINAITTNETYFFRDYNPFEMIKHKILPDIIDREIQIFLNL